jgi:hypothetical protein
MRQIGNAVPVKLARLIGRSVKEVLENHHRKLAGQQDQVELISGGRHASHFQLAENTEVIATNGTCFRTLFAQRAADVRKACGNMSRSSR